MSQELLEVLMHFKPAEARKRLNVPIRELDARVLQLTAALNGQSDSPEREAILNYIGERACESSAKAKGGLQPPPSTPELEELLEWARNYYRSLPSLITSELLEWARQEFSKFSEEELLAGIREIETTGGLELKDFIHELEQEVARE